MPSKKKKRFEKIIIYCQRFANMQLSAFVKYIREPFSKSEEEREHIDDKKQRKAAYFKGFF